MITKTGKPQFENWDRAPKWLAEIVGVADVCRATKGEYLFKFYWQVHPRRCFGDITQITINKINSRGQCGSYKKDWEEPTYSEKVQIKQVLKGSEKAVVMEIFPRQSNVVDRADVYHIWIAEMAKFPFGISEATEVPEDKKWETEKIGGMDIEYKVRTIRTAMGKVAYFYIRRTDGKELRWVEKQNYLQSEQITAIEIISEQGIGKPTCLICLPLGYSLDFGLHIS